MVNSQGQWLFPIKFLLHGRFCRWFLLWLFWSDRMSSSSNPILHHIKGCHVNLQIMLVWQCWSCIKVYAKDAGISSGNGNVQYLQPPIYKCEFQVEIGHNYYAKDFNDQMGMSINDWLIRCCIFSQKFNVIILTISSHSCTYTSFSIFLILSDNRNLCTVLSYFGYDIAKK